MIHYKNNSFNPYNINKNSLYSLLFSGTTLTLIALVLVSYYISVSVMLLFFSDSSLGFVVASLVMIFCFEMFKAFSKLLQEAQVIPSGRLFLVFIKSLLVLLSAFFTLLYVNHKLASPNIESVRNKELLQLKKDYQKKETSLKSLLDSQIKTLNQQAKNEMATVRDLYNPMLEELNSAITIQAQICRNGVCEGGRVKALRSQIKILTDEYNHEVRKVSNHYREQITDLNSQYTKNISEMNADFEEDIYTINNNEYESDFRVQNPIIYDFKKSFNQLFSINSDYIIYVWLISIIISVALESMIIFLSAKLANTFSPRLRDYLQYREEVERAANSAVLNGSEFANDNKKTRQRYKSYMDDIIADMEEATQSYTSRNK